MLRKYKQRNYDVAHTKQRFSIKKFKFVQHRYWLD